MYLFLPQFENNANASAQLPEMLCCFKWFRAIFYVITLFRFYVMTLVSFFGIGLAIFEFNLLAEGNLLEQIACALVFIVIAMSIYGLCLACCLEHAFKRMANGELAPQSNSNNNRSLNYNMRNQNPYGTGTRVTGGISGSDANTDGSQNKDVFKAFAGKGQKIG